MDYKQLLSDVFHFKFKSFKVRYFKLIAVVQRSIYKYKYIKFESPINIKQIPIIINNRNRLTYLLQLISWLEKSGYTNIHIIDNDSTYPPLIEYYSTTNYQVHRLYENVGHLALWKSDLIKKFENNYYVYTDPDILPISECPESVLLYFMEQLKKYKGIEKIGFGLKIDDLPAHYSEKEKVIEWESRFWNKEIAPSIYDAAIDTTFALYRPYTNGFKWVQNAYRTGGVYVAKHLPWYENSGSPSEEDIFYRANVRQGASHWIGNNQNSN